MGDIVIPIHPTASTNLTPPRVADLIETGTVTGLSGKMTGAASSTADNIVTFADTSGKAAKDSGVAITAIAGKMTGAASSTSGNLVSFADTSGKAAADSGILATNVSGHIAAAAPHTGHAKGPGSSTAGNLAVFTNTDGQTLSDGGAVPTTGASSNQFTVTITSASAQSTGAIGFTPKACFVQYHTGDAQSMGSSHATGTGFQYGSGTEYTGGTWIGESGNWMAYHGAVSVTITAWGSSNITFTPSSAPSSNIALEVLVIG